MKLTPIRPLYNVLLLAALSSCSDSLSLLATASQTDDLPDASAVTSSSPSNSETLEAVVSVLPSGTFVEPEPTSGDTNANAVVDSGLVTDLGVSADAGKSAAVNPCSLPNAGALADLDGDQLADVCDSDDDNDGFADSNDPEPLDPTIPGDFSSPETIVEHPTVKEALKALSQQGLEFPLQMETQPPGIAGYYVQPTAKFIATGNGLDVDAASTGTEYRFSEAGPGLINIALVTFSGTKRFSHAAYTGSFLRGEGNKFTTYSTGRSDCTSAPYSIFTLSINTGSIDPNSGDILELKSMYITIATRGTYTTACNYGGDTEVTGGWQVLASAKTTRVAYSLLAHMCLGALNAYVPGEQWTESDGTPCACDVDFKTTCN